MAGKFFIETFGCQMNELDSEKIAGSLFHEGMQPAADISEADVVVLNTCAVREKAVQKVYARLGEIRGRKRAKPGLVVCVAGCMAQLETDGILRKAPFVDIVAGPQKGRVMGELVSRSLRTRSVIVERRSDQRPEPLETDHVLRRHPWRASVTISEGCSRRCAYCVVPAARGRERARASADIIREIEELASKGCIEILLLGQTVNSYRDPSAPHGTFARLLRRIAEIQGIRRIRFTSPHPADFSEELLDAMVSIPQICNHIHLPVQSGSNKVLRAMRRGYTRERYLEIIRRIRSASRDIAISTDVIVGFPGEEEQDFQDTLSLFDEVQYDSAYSFKYSPRPNTEALNLPGEVPEEEKKRRLSVLQEKQRRIQYDKNAACVGRIEDVLVEGRARSRVRLTGRTVDNRIVNFDGPETLVGRIVRTEITAFSPNSLKGRWIREEKDGRPSDGDGGAGAEEHAQGAGRRSAPVDFITRREAS